MRSEAASASDPNFVKVPGAGATTVHGERIWSDLFAFLRRGRTRLSLLFHAAKSKRPERRSPETQVWPMPLPFPEMHVAKRRGRGRRRQIDGCRKLGLNFIILIFNFLFAGPAAELRSSVPGLGTPLNYKQWAVVKRLTPLMDQWNEESAVGPAEMGRTAAKIESVEQVIEELSRLEGGAMDIGGYSKNRGQRLPESWGARGDPGEVVGSLSKAVEHVAKDLEADRIKLWSTPQFDPLPYLDVRNQLHYEFPLDHARRFDPEAEHVPRVRVRCSKKELIKFLHLLDCSDRLHLLPGDAVRPGLDCGAFAIPKDEGRDRLILDARPPNQCEKTEDRWINSLGAVHQLGFFHLKKEEQLRMHTEDLREFYHSFKIGDQRRIRNCLKVRLTVEEARQFSSFNPELEGCSSVAPSLNTMAMGDCNAVAFGQTSHLGALVQAGAISVRDLICLRQTPPRQRWFCGLMIDDFLVAEAVPIDIAEDAETHGKEVIEKVRECYLDVGLPRHEGKSEEFASKCCFWGVEVNGVLGTVRPSLRRAVPLCFLILRILQLQCSTVGLLEILSGSLVSIFQIERRHMSVLEEIYNAQRGRGQEEVIRLSSSLVDELLSCIGLVAVTSMNLRLEPSTTVIASDASSRAEAAVVTDLGKPAVEELKNLGLSKCLWNRLLNPYAAYFRERGALPEEEELPGGDVFQMHPVWEEISSSCQFRQYGPVVEVKKRRHINLGEIRSALAAERRFALQRPGHYFVHLQDSQVSLACMSKGRSSSRHINYELQKSIPFVTGQQVRGYLGFVRSKWNPSDDPTRGATVRLASREKAAWLADLEAGKFEGYDGFLAREGLTREDISGLPAESELYGEANLDLRRVKDCKRERLKLIAAQSRKREEKRMQPKLPVAKKEEDRRRQRGAGERSGKPEDEKAPDQNPECPPAPAGSSLPLSSRFEQSWCSEELFQLLCSFDPSQFIFSSSFSSLHEALSSGPGFLDLFSGQRGVAKSLARKAKTWVLCFDLSHDPGEDLLDSLLQVRITKLVLGRVFRAMGAGPVCASFSTAITPPTRTLLHPGGVPWASEKQKAKNRQGNLMLKFVLSLCCIFSELGLHWWVENPCSSWLWRQPGKLSWNKLLFDRRVGDLKIDYCRFSTPWRKRTRFKTTLHLASQSCTCECSKPHLQLRGKCPRTGMNFTKLAEPYPRGVCEALATAMLIDTGLLPRRRALDINRCARHVGQVIGEAQHPGPAFRRGQRDQDLGDVSLLEPVTIQLRSRVFAAFRDWALQTLDPEVFEWVLQHPVSLVKLLVNYGHESFRTGMPLMYYRQLLAHLQKEIPELRAHLGPGWETVTKWELLEPVQHRPPLPEPLLEACVALGLKWGWFTWTGCLALCFFGACRIGEVLGARRSDLLTPSDLMSAEPKLYLRIGDPKSRRRGANIQYTTVDIPFWTNLICKIFEDLPRDARLYEATPSAFRTRWNAVLKQIGVDSRHRLTPGSLRAGGAIAAHKRGLGINDLLWKLRLQHLKTLSHYLQETTAVSVLPSLPEKGSNPNPASPEHSTKTSFCGP